VGTSNIVPVLLHSSRLTHLFRVGRFPFSEPSGQSNVAFLGFSVSPASGRLSLTSVRSQSLGRFMGLGLGVPKDRFNTALDALGAARASSLATDRVS
jgi:hypothetical protein